jgi:general secretion pathway protein B
MSFILDALKKSESDRQRQSGPALFEVKVAPPRHRLPLWAIAVALLLAVNLVILAWMLLKRPAVPAEAALAAAGPAAAPLAPPTLAAPSPPAPAPQADTPVPVASGAPPVTAVPASAAATSVSQTALVAAPNTGAEEQNPEDLAPAAEPAPLLNSHVRRGTVDGVPLYQEWAATPGTHVPTLRLDLHVYAANPGERFVMINMKKLREGDTLPEGVRVESITPEGAVLSYSGSRFLLPRD